LMMISDNNLSSSFFWPARTSLNSSWFLDVWTWTVERIY
jgi:hypothetical protein